MIARRLLLSAAMIAVLTGGAADAATFHHRDRTASVYLRGDIEEGDAAAFRKLMRKLKKQGIKIERIFLDSPGGSHLDSVVIGNDVRALNLDAVVEEEAHCSSACTTIWASARHKAVFPSSEVGVHRARNLQTNADGSEELIEDESARQTTKELARRLQKHGAPASVVKKLLSTPGNQMTYLDADDLKAWKVEVIGGVEYQPKSWLERLDDYLRALLPKWMAEWVRQPMVPLTIVVLAGWFGMMILLAMFDAMRGKRRTA